jgi:hypothetical protein
VAKVARDWVFDREKEALPGRCAPPEPLEGLSVQFRTASRLSELL